MNLIAQGVTVKGKLVSAADQAPLPYATISVSRETAPASSIKKMATREDGTFSASLSPGKYIFSFHFVGMNGMTKLVEVAASQSPLDMGTVSMTESATELDELSVVAQKPLVKVELDKLTYSAKDDPESSTSNVL
ncbi:carboxypeptidase-like regulatory domain-containing protein, partial [Proteiniphilum sp. UBA1028]|uniref:carboxypeptidase-like regulatory domain-containing protein n=1 Tax=Proteiniphilum sp. UBA1028 TaxID=1947251 RepID=UPI0025D83188